MLGGYNTRYYAIKTHINQWIKIELPNMGMYVFSHFVFNRDINNYKPEIKQYLQQIALEKLYGHI